MNPRILLAALAAFCLFMQQASAAEPVRIMVSIPPQVTFVEKIGGRHVDVQTMVQPGASPATYEPKPQQMVALSKADLYLAIGVPFEQTWLDRFADTEPDLRIVQTDESIDKIPMDSGQALFGTDVRQQDDRHDSARLDPHIWLSPSRVKQLARSIAEVLQQIDPGHSRAYASRLNSFLQDIDQLDRELAALFHDHSGDPFLVYHPSWGYLAQEYKLRQVPIEYQGKSPTPDRIQRIVEWARRSDIQSVFVQPQFSQQQARTIAQAFGGRLVQADPLARDWADNLRRVAERIAEDLE